MIDTSLIFPHNSGPPYKLALRFIASKYLNMNIQQGTHDSTQDAIAAVRLVKLKIEKGPAFASLTAEQYNVLQDFGRDKKVFFVDRPQVMEKFTRGSTASIIPAYDDNEAVGKLTKLVSEGNFSFAYSTLYDLISHLNSEKKASQLGTNGGKVEEEGEIKIPTKTAKEVLAEIDKKLEEVIQATPSSTLIVVMGGEGDKEEMFKQHKQKKSDSQWNEFHQAQLEKIVQKIRSTFINIYLKN